MRIAVTGINGFVGSHIAEHLKKQYEVVGIGRRKEKSINCSEYFRADIGIAGFWREVGIEPVDVIVHAAACLEKEDFAEELLQTNCLGTFHIAEMARELKCRKLIYISSLPVIGIPRRNTITEEELPIPETMYHATKLAGEYIVSQLVKYGIEAVSLRISSPAGVEMPEHTIVPVFLSRALAGDKLVLAGRGTRKQNYVHVSDIAKAVERCIVTSGISGCFNIASSEAISNYELAKLCISLAESQSEIVWSGKKDRLDEQKWNVDISKAEQILSYWPIYTIREILQEMIDYQRRQL